MWNPQFLLVHLYYIIKVMEVIVIEMPINENIGHVIKDISEIGYSIVYLGSGLSVIRYEGGDNDILEKLGEYEYKIISRYDPSYGISDLKYILNP